MNKELRRRILDVMIYGTEAASSKPEWLDFTLKGEGVARPGGYDSILLSTLLGEKREDIKPELDYLASIGRINKTGAYYWYSRHAWES